MSDFIKKIVYDLLFYKRSSTKETEWFSDKMHNKDLVPQFDIQTNEIIDAFEKYHKISYDTQGLRDQGIDVLLRYSDNKPESESSQYIGFQIKSENDLHDKGWLTKLKAQVLDAKSHVNMEDYYIIVCINLNLNKNHDILRNIQAEFAKVEGVHVVRPEFVLTFLKLSSQHIGAYLKAKLSSEDQVYKSAHELFIDLTPHQGAILIELVVSYYLEAIEEYDLLELQQTSFVQSVYSDLPNLIIDYYYDEDDFDDEFEENKNIENCWNEDIDSLESKFIEIESRENVVKIKNYEIAALTAITLDGNVRYGYQGKELKNYLFRALMDEKIFKAEEYRSQ